MSTCGLKMILLLLRTVKCISAEAWTLRLLSSFVQISVLNDSRYRTKNTGEGKGHWGKSPYDADMPAFNNKLSLSVSFSKNNIAATNMTFYLLIICQHHRFLFACCWWRQWQLLKMVTNKCNEHYMFCWFSVEILKCIQLHRGSPHDPPRGTLP